MSQLVEEAMSELRVALAQSIPSDDRIIMDHVANALDLLEREANPISEDLPDEAYDADDFRDQVLV